MRESLREERSAQSASLNGHYRSLVKDDVGEISRLIYSDPDIYRLEQEKIFSRAWLYVGHESQIREPGDFILSRMGEESVIVARDESRTVRVMLNTCRHRGMKVCRYDEGNTKKFYCPYHAWTYRLDGSLVGVPAYESTYHPPFKKADWGLVQVAKIAILRGAIWAKWDPQAPSFDTYLGKARESLELAFRPMDGGDGEIEIIGGIQKWIIQSNWKMIAENGSGDILHGVSHRSADIAGFNPSTEEGQRRDPTGQLALSTHPEGHGFIYSKRPIDQEREEYTRSPVVAQWFKEKWRIRIERMGERAGIAPYLGAIFPNMSFHAQQPRSILMAHPAGPEKTELWRVYFVDRDAPAEVKKFMRFYYLSYSGPAGMTEQDDMENWQYATEGTSGTVARRYPFHYKAGMGLESSDADIPGVVTQVPIESEQNARAVYRRWASFMDAENWGELLSQDVA